jgi:hypothetical protein
MFVLALSDPAQITLAVFQLAFSAVVSIVLWKLTAAQRKTEGMETKLGDLTAKLVEERFRGMTHQVNGDVNRFSLTLQTLAEKLKQQDDNVDGLSERDQKIELSMNTKLDGLKDWLRENMASKKDLDKHESGVEHKFEGVQRDVKELATAVAVLGEKVKGSA